MPPFPAQVSQRLMVHTRKGPAGSAQGGAHYTNGLQVCPFPTAPAAHHFPSVVILYLRHPLVPVADRSLGIMLTRACHLTCQALRVILASEGIPGLYRGLGASLMTYMPASAIWWSAYGAYQRLIWRALHVWPHIPMLYLSPVPGIPC